MEDEAKLKFFTRPLPGYEAGRRVPVNVVISGGPNEFKSTLLSPPLPELRSTTSDVTLRKPRWDSPERRDKTASDRAMPAPSTNRELSGSMALGNSFSLVDIPRSPSTSDFGVIGDGRSQASSQQQNRHLVPIQSRPKNQSPRPMWSFLDPLVHPNLQASPNLKAAYAHGDAESSISQCEDSDIVTASILEAIPPVRRSRSYCNFNPWASDDSDFAVMRRVSRPVAPLTSSSVNLHPEETGDDFIAQPKLPPARILITSVPHIWKRGGPPYTAISGKRNPEKKSSDGLSSSRFDPESFTLPSGVC